MPLANVQVSRLTAEGVRALASRSVNGSGPVVSLYLDVDGRRHVRPADYELQLDRLLRDARKRHAGDRAIAAGLDAVEAFVKGGFDRSRIRGLAVFASCGTGVDEVVGLPAPVRNQLVVNHTPVVRQLEAVLECNPRFGVLLVDRQRARMLVFERGELVERSERFDALPRHEDDRGDWDRDHVRDHTAAAADRHLKAAASVAFEVWKERPFDHLVVGAPDELVPAVEKKLPSELRSRVAAHLSMPVGATEAQLRDAALDLEERLDTERRDELVGKLRDAVAVASRGVAGLPNTLDALFERRVDTLLVSDAFESPGWRCRDCGKLAIRGRKCPSCNGSMDDVSDVVEEAVEEALVQACRVETCQSADLDVLGGIGALLRY